METVRNVGGKSNKNSVQDKTGKFYELINLTQSMTNGLTSSVENKVFKNIDDVGKLKNLPSEDIQNLKYAVKIRSQKSEILLKSRVEKSLQLASSQISQALSKEILRVEKNLNRIEKKLSKLEQKSL